MMKMILICTLMTLIMIKVNGQDSDTLYQTISYQKTLLKKGRFEIWGYTSYTLYWGDESGLGININLNKKRKYGNAFIRSFDNRDWFIINSRIGNPTEKDKNISTKQRYEISTKGYSFSKILWRNDK